MPVFILWISNPAILSKLPGSRRYTQGVLWRYYWGIVVLTWVSLSICQIWRIFKALLSLLKAAGNSECSFSLCRANGYTSHMQIWPYNNYDINDNSYLLSQSFSIHLPQSLSVRFLLITAFSLSLFLSFTHYVHISHCSAHSGPLLLLCLWVCLFCPSSSLLSVIVIGFLSVIS